MVSWSYPDNRRYAKEILWSERRRKANNERCRTRTGKTGIWYIQDEAKNAWVRAVMISNHVDEACLRNCTHESYISPKIKKDEPSVTYCCFSNSISASLRLSCLENKWIRLGHVLGVESKVVRTRSP